MDFFVIDHKEDICLSHPCVLKRKKKGKACHRSLSQYKSQRSDDSLPSFQTHSQHKDQGKTADIFGLHFTGDNLYLYSYLHIYLQLQIINLYDRNIKQTAYLLTKMCKNYMNGKCIRCKVSQLILHF